MRINHLRFRILLLISVIFRFGRSFFELGTRLKALSMDKSSFLIASLTKKRSVFIFLGFLSLESLESLTTFLAFD